MAAIQIEQLESTHVSLTGKVRIVAQALDNQWAPRELLRTMMVEGKSRDHADIKPRLAMAVRTELRRALVNSEVMVVNRAYLWNNPHLFAHYLPDSPDREAFTTLLKDAIIPWFYQETDPVAPPSPTDPGFQRHPEGFEAWSSTCIDAQTVRCLRLSWDKTTNDGRTVTQLARRFHNFATTAVNGDLGLYVKDLGISGEIPQSRWRGILRLLRDAADKEGDRRFEDNKAPYAPREAIYKLFIATQPATGSYDGGALLSDDPKRDLETAGLAYCIPLVLELRNQLGLAELRQSAVAVKELVDLAYNAFLPDAVGGYALTPWASLRRTALQEYQTATNLAQERTIEFTVRDLLGFLRRDVFDSVMTTLNPRALGDLSLQEIVDLRATPEWLAYANSLENLLAIKRPNQFRSLAPDVVDHYFRMLQTRVPSDNVGSWSPVVSVLIDIAGQQIWARWTKGQAVRYDVRGSISNAVDRERTPVIIKLNVGDPLNDSADVEWNNSIDFARGRVSDPEGTVQAVVSRLNGHRSDYVEGNVVWQRPEPTVNQS